MEKRLKIYFAGGGGKIREEGLIKAGMERRLFAFYHLQIGTDGYDFPDLFKIWKELVKNQWRAK